MAKDAQSNDGLGLNLVRACSEAITVGVSKILNEPGAHPAQVFTQQLNPIPAQKSQTLRYMIPLLNGGKQAGSAVKFSKFYLVIDPTLCTQESLVTALEVFQKTLKKQMGAVKGGEAAFKTDQEGPMFNAFSSINDSFKQIEDALNAANSSFVLTQGKPLSADSAVKSNDTGSANTPKPIKIGVNCDAEFLFNKDPKDPNKYEIEGAKGV